ncbi:transcription initiation factor TFIID subunit 5-like [Patiria miniata]|uniref:Transcription initiation factor TFIID subunit 5 n=1 Tax=Patiria miniata TaxID=46514 RepID=A0A913ZBA3_PATMI|nr:transcription initiation factor TFIID subunit 5-like [Patiria miniata]
MADPTAANPNQLNASKNDDKSLDKQTLAAVLQFLRKNNLKDTEDLLKKEANIEETDEGVGTSTDQEVTSVLSAYNSDGDPCMYEEFYRGLQNLIEASLDSSKSELSQVLYPVFVHMYLELVYNGHENQAKNFFASFSEDQEEHHQEDLIRLATFTKKEHMIHNELMMNYRTSKYVIRMCRNSYQALKRQLHDRQNTMVLNIVEEHLFIDVFDGVPRSKQQIEATAGGMVGQARRDANKSRVYYGLLKEPEISLPIEEEDEGGEDGDKPKRKRPKKDSSAGKKNKPDPNAPPVTRIPLLEMKDSDKIDKAIALRELSKRIRLGPDCLPSICFYTFLNAFQGLISVDISDDSSLMVAGFADSCIRVWALTQRKLRSMKLGSDLTHIDKEADDVMERIMDDRTASDCRTLLGHSGSVYSVSISPDRTYILSGSEDGTVRLWSMFTFSNLVCYKGHNYPVWDVQFAPYGHYFVSGGNDRTARLWTTENYQPIRLFAGHFSDIDCIRFHPNSNYVATGSSDRTIRLWDLQNGKCVRIMTGHKGPIQVLCFSPNGHYLASGSTDGRVLIWELRHGHLVAELANHTDTVYALAFCRDGSVLASGGMDNCVKLWDVKKVFSEVEAEDMTTTPNIVQSVKSKLLLGSYPSKDTPVYYLHFTRRNLLLAAGSYANTSS